jgi:hypothetical protein
MMVGQQCALTLEKIQKTWYLLEIRRYVRNVPAQMHVVELQVHDVFDSVAEIATCGRERWCGAGKE